MDTWQDRLYMGTWQLGGQFQRSWSEPEAAKLLQQAWKLGIRNFDTAAVYGNGVVEQWLGRYLPTAANVVTKIPALRKPPIDSETDSDYYPETYVTSQLVSCCSRLGRNSLDAVLLHNWSRKWKKSRAIEQLEELKRKGRVRRIGISLPDGFNSILPDELVDQLDVVELPYNPLETWANACVCHLQTRGSVTILLRSILLQGMLHRSEKERMEFPKHDVRHTRYDRVSTIPTEPARSALRRARETGAALVIGMTTPAHIAEAVTLMKER